MCPMGPHGPPRGGRPKFCTASGGLEADESVSVDKRNPYTTPWRHRIGVSPVHGRFSMAITNFRRVPISETRPISKACQHVMRASTQTFLLAPANVSSAFPLHHEARSGPCSIVRGREDLNCSQRILTLGHCRSRTVSDWSVCDLNRRFKTSHTNFCFKRCSGSA